MLAHVSLIGVLLWMSALSGRILLGTVASDPPGFATGNFQLFLLAISVIPLALAGLLTCGLISWVRVGGRRILVVADALALAASWSILLAYLLADESPLLAFGLESICLACVVAVRPPGAQESAFRPGWGGLAASAVVGTMTAGFGIYVLRSSTSDSTGALAILVAISLTATVYTAVIAGRRWRSASSG